MALRGFDALVASIGDDSDEEVVDAPDEVQNRAPGVPALQPFDAGGDFSPASSAPLIKSEISGVNDEAWTDFVRVLRTAQTGSVSASNQLGAFEMRPRRLQDLGLMKNVKFMRSPSGALMQVGDWVPPLNQNQFLSNPRAQYLAFVASMKSYVTGLRSGAIAKPRGGVAKGMTLSGILAILHRCGAQGLAQWNDPDKRFENTVDLVEKANGIF